MQPSTDIRDREARLDQLLESPQTKAIEAKARAKTLRERKRRVRAIAELEAEFVKELAPLRDKEDKAARVAADARILAIDLHQKHLAAVAERRNHSNRHAVARGRLEAQLAALAPKIIDAFLTEMRELDADLSGRSEKGHQDQAKIARALEMVRAARRDAQQLKLQALSEDEIEAKLQDWRTLIAEAMTT